MTHEIPPGLTASALAEIGRVVTCGGWLELQLAALVSSIAVDEGQGAAFSDIIKGTAGQIEKKLRKIADLHPSNPEGVLELADRATILIDRRNAVVHAQWGSGHGRGSYASLRFDRTGESTVLLYTAKELNRLAGELHRAAADAMTLIVTPDIAQGDAEPQT